MDLEELKAKTKQIWTLGDYGAVARAFEDAAERLVEACGVRVGQHLLDVGAGNGNVALAAARRGARVLASDITPAQVERGRVRAEAEGLYVEWEEADAEDLPHEDGSFDVVTSAFGAMFAPRPEIVAREMFRVLKPGETLGMANWARDGYVGELVAIIASYVESPPEIPAPVLWGDEVVARERLAPYADEISCERHFVRWDFASLEDKRAFEVANFGPVIDAKQSLAPDRFDEMMRDVEGLIMEHNHATQGRIVFDADYLIVTARKKR